MRETIDGEDYLSIGGVAKIIGRSPQTIKSWYVWAGDNGVTLPEIVYRGGKKTRYFLIDDIPKLEEFRDSIKYGQMATVSRTKWGDRGK